MVISDTAIHMLTYPTQAISGGWTFYARLVMLTSLFLSFWVCVCVLNHRPYPTNAAQCQPAQVYYTHMLYHPAITHGHMAMKIRDFPIQIYHWDFPARMASQSNGQKDAKMRKDGRLSKDFGEDTCRFIYCIFPRICHFSLHSHF
jgi:hypothetical protein